MARLLIFIFISAIAQNAFAQVSPSTPDTLSPTSSIAERFSKQMSKIVPITGEFVLEGMTKVEFALKHEEIAKARAAEKNLGVKFQPDRTLLACRWSWDGSRELLETLEGSNIWNSFYNTPDAMLDGNSSSNFNITKPSVPYPIRPGSFYHCFGSESWPEIIKNGTVKEQSPETEALALEVGDKANVFSVSTADKVVYVVAVSKENGTLLAAESYYDGGLCRRLSIAKLNKSDDGKFFPENATLEIFNPVSSKLIRFVSLDAKKIEYPKTASQIDKAMTLKIAKGAAVYDLVRGTNAVLSKPTSAEEILRKSLKKKSSDSKR